MTTNAVWCVICDDEGDEVTFATGPTGHGDERVVPLCDKSECLEELEARGLDS